MASSPTKNVLMQLSKQFGETAKTVGQQSGSAKGHLQSVQLLFKNVESAHDNFKTEVDSLSKSLHILREKVKNNPSDIRKYVAEKLNRLEDQTILSQEHQKQQNRVVQQTMTQIKRQNRETQQQIGRTVLKLKQLEKKVGYY